MFTEAQINELKALHGEWLQEVTVHTGNTTEKYIIKIPPRSVVDAAADAGWRKEVNEVSKTLIANCVVAGDMEKLERNGKIYTTVLHRIKDEMGTYKSEIKKL